MKPLLDHLIALSRISRWLVVPCAAVAGCGVLAVLGSSPGAVQLCLRLSGLLVAAVSAVIVEDEAADTLAATPTSLMRRRAARLISAGMLAGLAWWMLIAVAGLRAADLPLRPLTPEVIVLTALALGGSVVAQDHARDRRGAPAGAVLAITWFSLSFMPRIGRIPLPPDPLRRGAGATLMTVALVSVTAALIASRDPAAR